MIWDVLVCFGVFFEHLERFWDFFGSFGMFLDVLGAVLDV